MSRIISFLEKFVPLDPYQYGFLKNSSTLSATTDLINHLSEYLDKGKVVIAVFIDLRKAFDVVSHNLLISKLERMGFRGAMLRLIKSYLLNHQQYVALGDSTSEIVKSNCGVPQGSALGPLLYSLFNLNLRLEGLRAQYYTFADDTVLVYTGDSAEQLSSLANDDLNRYYCWIMQNKLKINLDKSKYMLFTQKKIKL